MHSDATTTPAVDVDDPASLRAAWDALRAREHHLHNPQAAMRLGVTEAALIASRAGAGATRLITNIDALLGPVRDWGRVLVAVANPVAVSLTFFENATPTMANGRWCLDSGGRRVEVDASAVRHAWYFEDHDAHGNTRSLQLFDERGDAVAKVFVFAKSRLDAVRGHVAGVASSMTAPATPIRAARASPNPGAVDTQAGDVFIRAFESAAGRSSAATVTVSTGRAWQRARGRIARITHAGGGIHVAETDFKLHMFPSRVLDAAPACTVDGETILRFRTPGGGMVSVTTGDLAGVTS